MGRVARGGDKLKTCSFTKIKSLRLLDSQFAPDPSVDKTLAEEDGIWLGED